ncbi:MAG: S8 family serine peptidase [Thermoanaerobaculaceae bacterium]|nr:S8 family serine peptidase [Thermoanaerobaculaceae bacterium]
MDMRAFVSFGSGRWWAGPGLVVGLVSWAFAAASAQEPSGRAGWATRLTPGLVSAAQDATGSRGCILVFREPEGGLQGMAAAGRSDWIARTASDLAGELAPSGVIVTRRFSHLPMLAASVPASRLVAVASDPRIAAVVPIRVVTVQRTQGKQLMHVPEVQAQGFKGAGIGVAILDTGVDYTHPELSPAGTKTIKLFDSIDNDSDPMDEHGHGTSVAAIAAGSGNGVAPDATVVAVRVLNADGEGSSEQVLAGIDAVLASISAGNPHHIRVVNMSLGGYDEDDWPPGQGSCDAASTDFATAFEALVNAGVLITVAAGNGGCTGGVAWPACISHATAVGAVYDASLGPQSWTNLQCNQLGCFDFFTDADDVACYSDSGEKLGVWAPSTCATTAVRGGGTEDCFGGTSAAAPYVAGVAALLSQAVPGRSVAGLRQALEQTGHQVTDPRNGIERRRVDAQQALVQLQTGCSAPAAPAGLGANRTRVCSGEPVTLSWGAVSGASGYTLQVDDGPSFASPEQLTSSTTSASYSTTRTTAATLYFRVRADASCGLSSTWSTSAQVVYAPGCTGPSYPRAYYVSGIARLPGVPPTDWYSDLSVLNTSSLAASLRLSFYGGTAPPSVTATVLSGQQLTSANVLQSLFAVSGQDVGVIVVESTQPLIVQARTYSKLVVGGVARTYGQSYEGLEITEALTAGALGYLPGLRSDGQFRTNLEVVNVGDVSAAVEVRFYNNGAVPVGQPLTLAVQPARRVAVTRALPSGETGAYAVVRVTTSGARVIGFASVVDGTSGDPTTVAMGVR